MVNSTIIIGIVLFIFLWMLFRKYLSALIYDYVVDLGISSLDTVFLAAGLPITFAGDVIAGALIYYHERKIVGMWAFIPALEAMNFLVGLVPGVGWPIEIVTNLTPAVFLTRLAFNKFGQAEAVHERVEENIELAKQLGIHVPHKIKKQTKKSKKELDDAPVETIEMDEKSNKQLAKRLKKKVHSIIGNTQNIILRASHIEAPPELIKMLEANANEANLHLQVARKAEKERDFARAVDLAHEARAIMEDALTHFQQEFVSYQQTVQNIDQNRERERQEKAKVIDIHDRELERIDQRFQQELESEEKKAA